MSRIAQVQQLVNKGITSPTQVAELINGNVSYSWRLINKIKTADHQRLDGGTAKEVISLVKERTGQEITTSPKNKKHIVKQAEALLASWYNPRTQE